MTDTPFRHGLFCLASWLLVGQLAAAAEIPARENASVVAAAAPVKPAEKITDTAPALTPEKKQDSGKNPDSPPLFAFNAFGTYGLAYSSEKRADFVFDNLQPNGAGHTRNPSANVDSRIGAQVTANLTPQLTAVAQVLSEYRWDGSYTPFLNWANVKYAVTPDFSVRVGRIALPSFMASASRKVGYSNPWIRPAPELYRLLALTNSDGIDITHRQHFGDTTNSVTALYGRKTVTNTRGIDVHSRDVWGVFDTLERGPLTLHAAYQERHVDNQNPPRGRFMSLGAAYDPGKWLAQIEWVKVYNYDGKGVLAVREAWNVSAAYRLGKFTPFASFSELRPLTDTGKAPVGQHTISAGVRWDFARNLDLKLQWDNIKLNSDSPGTLQNMQPGFKPGGRVNVISVALDFVY